MSGKPKFQIKVGSPVNDTQILVAGEDVTAALGVQRIDIDPITPDAITTATLTVSDFELEVIPDNTLIFALDDATKEHIASLEATIDELRQKLVRSTE